MKLSKICEKIKYECLQGSMEAEVRDIIYDSRKIAKETMFVCMVGAVTDGHKYIPDAVEYDHRVKSGICPLCTGTDVSSAV